MRKLLSVGSLELGGGANDSRVNFLCSEERAFMRGRVWGFGQVYKWVWEKRSLKGMAKQGG